MKPTLGAALAATLLITFSTPSSAADVIVLKVAHNGPEQHPFQNGFETFK